MLTENAKLPRWGTVLVVSPVDVPFDWTKINDGFVAHNAKNANTIDDALACILKDLEPKMKGFGYTKWIGDDYEREKRSDGLKPGSVLLVHVAMGPESAPDDELKGAAQRLQVDTILIMRRNDGRWMLNWMG